ncbi:MAG: precorrin-8X methylmutase [Elainellaceae cyanobacterium]
MPAVTQLDHPITLESFALIDQEMGSHNFTPQEYTVVRRVIHATADFEFAALAHFSPRAIACGLNALKTGMPIIVDVNMVHQGIRRRVQQTFQNPIWVAVEQAEQAEPGRTRTETGLLTCWKRCPQGIYVIGNAPTALLALCRCLQQNPANTPALVIGVPVGFVAVEEAKAVLARCPIPQILIQGRKGGSAAAAAIVNALLGLAWTEAHTANTTETNAAVAQPKTATEPSL